MRTKTLKKSTWPQWSDADMNTQATVNTNLLQQGIEVANEVTWKGFCTRQQAAQPTN